MLSAWFFQVETQSDLLCKTSSSKKTDDSPEGRLSFDLMLVWALFIGARRRSLSCAFANSAIRKGKFTYNVFSLFLVSVASIAQMDSTRISSSGISLFAALAGHPARDNKSARMFVFPGMCLTWGWNSCIRRNHFAVIASGGGGCFMNKVNKGLWSVKTTSSYPRIWNLKCRNAQTTASASRLP